MERGRQGRSVFNLGGLFPAFGGFGDHRSLLSDFFENDPFDDTFFTRPFGSMFSPGLLGPGTFGPSMLGSSILGHSMFGTGGNLSGDMPNFGFLEHRNPQANKSRGPVIQELSSDSEKGEEKEKQEEEDIGIKGKKCSLQRNKSRGPVIRDISSDYEGEEKENREEEEDKGIKEENCNHRKHSRLDKEPFIQEPDDETEGRKRKHAHYMSKYNRAGRMQPQTQTFSFQSSTLTYGGANGAYYTSSTTRRMGGDGLTMEEHKEADTTTGKATHRVSRGLWDKGHSVTRKLNSDGNVDTVQTLLNLDEDELGGFQEAWEGNARKHLPGWNQGFGTVPNGHIGGSSGILSQQTSRGWALPPTTELPENLERGRSHSGAKPSSSRRRA